jgi:hypothetical protein
MWIRIVVCVVTVLSASLAWGQALNPDPPSVPVKLIFIHHSTGENWLSDGNGGLGIALRNANYFVSDTYYGWGPPDEDAGYANIGDHTDIGNWYSWFSGPHSGTYLSALYPESGQISSYSRLATDPGGENRIVMFKSCFPNSNIQGSPTDPVPPIGSNPLRGQDCGSSDHTVANAKGIYIELRNYFASRPDKIFIVIAAPPLRQGDTTAEYASNARAFNEWLVNDWLVGYSKHNVFVFDFYNVLTSDGGSTRVNNPNLNDLGWSDGNHHRLGGGAIQHLRTVSNNYLAYWTGDSHPSQAGNLKATGEFVSLLNIAHNCWNSDGGCPRWPSFIPLRVPSGTTPMTVTTTNQGADVTVNWDASLCASAGYHILYGYGSGLAAWEGAGGAGAQGTAGQDMAAGVPNAAGDASSLLWFLVAGNDGAGTEGSWGLTSASAERGGGAASQMCGCSNKVVAGSCDAQ